MTIIPIPKYNYVLLRGFWQGRTAYLLNVPREDNPYPADSSDQDERLAWFIGWDEQEEEMKAYE